MLALTIPFKSAELRKAFGSTTKSVRMPRAIPSVFSHFQRVIRRGNLNNKELTRIAAVFFYWCGKKEKQRCFSCFSHQWFDRFSNVSTSSHFTAFFAVACTRRVFSSRHRCSLTYTGSRGLRSRSLVESLMHRAFSSTTLCLERRVNWTTTFFFFRGVFGYGETMTYFGIIRCYRFSCHF